MSETGYPVTEQSQGLAPSPREIEAVARAMRKAGANYDDWHLLSEFTKSHYRLEAQAAIRALDAEREKNRERRK